MNKYNVFVELENNGNIRIKLYEKKTGKYYASTGNEFKVIKQLNKYDYQEEKIVGSDYVLKNKEFDVIFVNYDKLFKSSKFRGLLGSLEIMGEERMKDNAAKYKARETKKKRKKLKAQIQKVVATAAVTAILVGGVTKIVNLAQDNYPKTNDLSNIIIEEQVDLDRYEAKNTYEVNIIDKSDESPTIIEDNTIEINDLTDDTRTTTAINARSWEKQVTKYANKWGVSPNLVMGMLTQESGGYIEDNLMQIQFGSWEDQVITVYNFEANKYENIVLTKNPSKYSNYKNIQCISPTDLKNPNTNISVGTILLRQSISYMDGNVLLGVQCYNFGLGNMKIVLNVTKNETGISMEDLLNDESLINEILERTDVIKVGDSEYFNNVFRYVDGNSVFIKIVHDDGTITTNEIEFARDSSLSH